VGVKKVIECIKKNKAFLITAHMNLEGDALGSELAFYHLLKAMGKRVMIVNSDDIPRGYGFLPGVGGVKQVSRHLLNYAKFDCFAALDCSDLGRCGEVSKINLVDKTVLNIDHHISNNKFGDINWIEPSASSVCEMIYKLYKKLGVPFNFDSASCLYAGMLTDTGSFRYSNTSSFTHRAVSELVKFKLNTPQIYKNIYENIPILDMRLLIKILPSMRSNYYGKVVWFRVEKGLLKNKKLSFDLSENILSFARSIEGVEVAVLFKENLGAKDEIRVNLRSQGEADVNKIAGFFGGGGHKTASGCTIKGEMDIVIKKVLEKIGENLNYHAGNSRH